MQQERTFQLGDVVQIRVDENLPKEIQGCLGYLTDVSNPTNLTVRVYQPKTVGDWAEYSEYTLPSISFNFVGTVPADMQPL